MAQRLFPALLLFSALLLAATPARAEKDAVQFGSRIVVPEGQSIHDAVCFFCSVDARGSIDHDVVVFFRAVPGVPSFLRPFDFALVLPARRAAASSSASDSSRWAANASMSGSAS